MTDLAAATDSAPAPSSPRSTASSIREWVVVVVVALGVAMLIRSFVISPFFIPSESMFDTLTTGDRILVNRVSYRLHDVRRGDVIVFSTPPGAPVGPDVEDLIKRVIGLPGDQVEIRPCVGNDTNNVFVNGMRLIEPYTDGICTDPPGPGPDPDGDGIVTVPDGAYFVMGDNRVTGQSLDSRVWGFVEEDLIVGRAFVVIWPFGNWQWL